MKRYLTAFFTIFVVTSCLQGCSMTEEMRRIEAVKQMNERAAAARSTDLTGEQIFMRSCNTCHPAGKEGLGPALDKTNERYTTDEALTVFLRRGKGNMPGQPKNVIDEKEMKNLIVYLRALVEDLNQRHK
jgi:mono/diheme cytochrome c family protein